MIKSDKDDVICDFFEFYHQDLRHLDLRTAAVLAWGLPDDSRSKRALAGSRYTGIEYLLSAILDDLNLLIWSRTKDAEHGINRPESLLERLRQEPEEKVEGYEDPEDFMAYRARYVKGGPHG